MGRLQVRAADWFLTQGHAEDGIRALLEAGDHPRAAAELLAHLPGFLASGQVGVLDRLGSRLDLSRTGSVGLLLALAWAAGVSGRRERVPALLDRAQQALAAEPQDPGYPGFATAAGALAALRAAYGAGPGGGEVRRYATAAVAEERDPALPGWVAARVTLGGALLLDGEDVAAREVLESAWSAPASAVLPAFSHLEVAGLLGWSRLRTGATAEAGRLVEDTDGERAGLEVALGDAAGPAVALLHAVAAEVARKAGDETAARARSARAAELVGTHAHPGVRALVLVSAARIALDAGNARAALGLLDTARGGAGSLGAGVAETIAALTARARRTAVDRARATLPEALTDRELDVLRALGGDLGQRAIAAELQLSPNTVKWHVKSIYRKLGVASRTEAVARGRAMGVC
jgi:LuxR family maltose regulon positive regulatory protein